MNLYRLYVSSIFNLKICALCQIQNLAAKLFSKQLIIKRWPLHFLQNSKWYEVFIIVLLQIVMLIRLKP